MNEFSNCKVPREEIRAAKYLLNFGAGGNPGLVNLTSMFVPFLRETFLEIPIVLLSNSFQTIAPLRIFGFPFPTGAPFECGSRGSSRSHPSRQKPHASRVNLVE